MRQIMLYFTLLIALLLCLRCAVCAYDVEEAAINSADSSRRLQNKISSTHHIIIEFSGVAYASVSLDVVKADLLGVVEDVLTTHLGNDMEVVDVKRSDFRKLRGSSQRRLSYIRLVVSISLRYSAWISTESATSRTIDILSEYVDKDFRQYMKSLPGNGDYLGNADVNNYYTDIDIGVSANTAIPITSPTQINGQTSTTGSFQFKLVFTEVSTEYANSEVLRNYIRYGVQKVLNDNLDYDVQLVEDVSLQTWLGSVWLTFPILINLRYPKSRNDAFIHADDVLSRNIGDIDLYLNGYLATTPLSIAEMTELESTLKEVFGEMGNVEIGIVNTSSPTRHPQSSSNRRTTG